jgi:hypothetical protein
MFNKFLEHNDDPDRDNQLTKDIPLAVFFDPRAFYFINGRLKYCPPLLSQSHNLSDSYMHVD